VFLLQKSRVRRPNEQERAPRRPNHHERAKLLTDAQLARTVRSMARTFEIVDPYRCAVLDEAADRIQG
jgi:hypothetical protein